MNTSACIVLSCEHAGNRVPRRYRRLFAGRLEVLQTHRAVDIGIWSTARSLARILSLPLYACHTTRLLADPNRSPGHPHLFSEFTRGLPDEEKLQLLRTLHRPHRDAVAAAVHGAARPRRVVHLALHSFTPVLNGIERQADIGILYDPGRLKELGFALRLQDSLRIHTGLRIRRNYPYRGASDGLTSALRALFPEHRYLGIEIEFNQRLLTARPGNPRHMARKLAAALSHALADVPPPSTAF